MKIVVIGGTGLIGSKLVDKLRADGHDPLAASPNTGVDIITGQGLAEAFQGAQVVADVSNAPSWDDAAVMDFFQTSARNIAAAETAAGVGHHVALSVVGTDRLQASGYFRAKLAQEEAVMTASILRATQSSNPGHGLTGRTATVLFAAVFTTAVLFAGGGPVVAVGG